MGNKSSEKIIWVYEVRTIEVKSDIFMGGKISVAKTSDYTKHTAPIHRLELTFVDNKLISWGPSAPDEDEYTDEEEGEETEKEMIDAKKHTLNEMYDCYGFEEDKILF